MALARPVDVFPWEELLRELQLKILDLLLLVDLEYFSYASKANRQLYSDALPNQFRPQVIALLAAAGIALPIPTHAFLTKSKLTPGTFVLKKPMAELLGLLIRQCNYQFLAHALHADFNSFRNCLLQSHFKNHYVLHQIDFMMRLLLCDVFGIELMPDETKIPWITSDAIVTVTSSLAWLGADTGQAIFRSAMTTLGSHLDSLQLSSLASRLRERTSFRILELDDRGGQSPESTLKLQALERKAMDERSLFLGSLSSQTWSEKESLAKAALCSNDSALYFKNRRTAVASYRRICALTESEAVFFQRALLCGPAQPQPPANEFRFDHANLLIVLNALDKIALHEQGRAFIEELFTVKPDDSTNYKLAVFKQLLSGTEAATYQTDFLDSTLFSDNHMVNMFTAAYSLHAEFNKHNLDPVVYASVLLVLISNFECPKPKPTATSAEKSQAQRQAREQQRKRAAFFLEVMAFIKQKDSDRYTVLCGSLHTLINDLFKENDLGRTKALLAEHHYIVFTIGSFMISNIMINILNSAIKDNNLEVFFKSFSGWWEYCEASVDRSRLLPVMKQVSEQKFFLDVVKRFDFQKMRTPHRDLLDNIHLLLHPDSMLWCLPEASLRDLLIQLSLTPGYFISRLNSQFLHGLTLAKKERVLPRIQKLGPDFLILNEITLGNYTWLFSLLFTLPNNLFEAILSHISPILQQAQTADEKKADLNRHLAAAFYDSPGLNLYLEHRQTQGAYFKASHPLDDVPGAELVKMNATYLIDTAASIVKHSRNHNLFVFIAKIIKAWNNSDDREVQAIDLNALVQFIISHATEPAFLAYLEIINILRAEEVDSNSLIKLENYCRMRRTIDARRQRITRVLSGFANAEERSLSRIQKLGPDRLILKALTYERPLTYWPGESESWLFLLSFTLPDSLFEAVLSRISPILHSEETLENKKTELKRIFAAIGDLPGLLLYLNRRETKYLYTTQCFFALDAIPGAVLEEMKAIEFVSPPKMFSSPPCRGNLFDFTIRLLNSLKYYEYDIGVQAIDITALVHFIIEHRHDDKFLAFLRTVSCFYGEAVNAVPDSMIQLESYHLTHLAEDQPAATQPGHSPRLFVPASQSLVAPATAAGITTRLASGIMETTSTDTPNPSASKRL